MKRVFNPKRLNQALMYRNVTVSELAERVGEQRQTISMYRNGKMDHIDMEKVSKISNVLKFPLQFFFEVDNIVEDGAVFFRSQLTAKKNYVYAQKMRLNFLIKIYRFLSDYIDFPKTKIPNCAGLAPEEAASKLRDEWGLGTGPINNLVRIVEDNGIVVACCSTKTDAIDAFSKRFIREGSEEVFIIGYSENKKTAARIHFDIAHELGHIALHSSIVENLLSIEDRESDKNTIIGKSTYGRMEYQANIFASYLLMPNIPFYSEVAKLFDEYRIRTGRLYHDYQPCNIRDCNIVTGALSAKFNVSQEAVVVRMKRANLYIEGDSCNPLHEYVRRNSWW